MPKDPDCGADEDRAPRKWTGITATVDRNDPQPTDQFPRVADFQRRKPTWYSILRRRVTEFRSAG